MICRVSVGIFDAMIVLFPQCDGIVVDSRESPGHNLCIEGHQFPFREFFIMFCTKVCHCLRSYDGRKRVEGAGVDRDDERIEIRHFLQPRNQFCVAASPALSLLIFPSSVMMRKRRRLVVRQRRVGVSTREDGNAQ